MTEQAIYEAMVKQLQDPALLTRLTDFGALPIDKHGLVNAFAREHMSEDDIISLDHPVYAAAGRVAEDFAAALLPV